MVFWRGGHALFSILINIFQLRVFILSLNATDPVVHYLKEIQLRLFLKGLVNSGE